MKKFIIKIIVFCFVALFIFLFLLSRSDGNTDAFYLKFTTPKQENLILGTSRAAQGLLPSVFDKICNKKLYNYAFTLGNSPFGETYLNSIKKKVKKGDVDGVFIIAVDPWSICSVTENPNDFDKFREVNLCLGNTEDVSINPNFMYLFNNMGGRYINVLRRHSPVFLHDDGWLEVSIDMDSINTNTRINSKLEAYRNNVLPMYKYSTLRLHYLKKTIEFLNNYGAVYLVRLPIHSRMMEIENELMPNFNNIIEDVIPLTKGYMDMTPLNNNFIYTDGNHLYKKSGEKVSGIVANWIDTQGNE